MIPRGVEVYVAPDPIDLRWGFRLDAGTFRLPEPMIEGDTARLIDERAFDDLIDGLELAPVRLRAVH